MGNHSSLKIQVVQYIGQGLAEFSVCSSEKKKKKRTEGKGETPSPPRPDHACEETRACPAFSILARAGGAAKCQSLPRAPSRARAGAAGTESCAT